MLEVTDQMLPVFVLWLIFLQESRDANDDVFTLYFGWAYSFDYAAVSAFKDTIEPHFLDKFIVHQDVLHLEQVKGVPLDPHVNDVFLKYGQ